MNIQILIQGQLTPEPHLKAHKENFINALNGFIEALKEEKTSPIFVRQSAACTLYHALPLIDRLIENRLKPSNIASMASRKGLFKGANIFTPTPEEDVAALRGVARMIQALAASHPYDFSPDLVAKTAADLVEHGKSTPSPPLYAKK